MDINYTSMEQNNTNNQNIPVIINNNNDQNQDLNTPLFQNQTNSMNQINYNINKINDKHINNYGYFYINSNPVFELINQEKIKINLRSNFIFPKWTLFFFILFGIGGFLTGASRGVLFPIPIIGFIGFVVSAICYGNHQYKYNNDNYICYNKKNSEIEVNIVKNKKKMIVSLNSIERIIMEDADDNSVFYFINNLNEKMEFLTLPLQNGVPFKEGEEILNDWLNYLKSKEENTKV